MEETSSNVDRLVNVSMKRSGRGDRNTAFPLYESACKVLGGRSPSLLSAQRLIQAVNPGDNVILVAGFASYPNMPYGETDGAPGVASLARAISFGLRGVPIFVARRVEAGPIRSSAQAAGVNIVDYEMAKDSAHRVAMGSIVEFTAVDKEPGEELAASIINQYSPKAVIAVETVGPNSLGVKHFAGGTNVDWLREEAPCFEQLFYQATAKDILTIGVIDKGNEIGSGAIEEKVREIVPWANKCQCPCGGGIACVVKTDIVLPAAISNWGAYAISAMLAYLLRKPEILQDADTERRILEACIMAGSIDSESGGPTMAVDGVSCRTNQALVTMLHELIENALITKEVPQ